MVIIVSFFMTHRHNHSPVPLDLVRKLAPSFSTQIHNSRSPILLVLESSIMLKWEGQMILDPDQINSRFFSLLILTSYCIFDFRFMVVSSKCDSVTACLSFYQCIHYLVFYPAIFFWDQPFENKWTRFSPLNTNSSSSLRQSDSQTSAPSHK